MTPSWSVNDVRPMAGAREQFTHVAKHLYRAAEHWEQVIPDLGDARRKACTAGCTTSDFSGARDYLTASESCRAHVIGDHKDRYAPAYLQAVREAEAVGQLPDDGHGPHGWAFVDRWGVFVIVRGKQPKVRTAFRVIPPSETNRPEDFRKAAARKLRDMSSNDGRGT